jgi:hypothetical protein
VLPEVNAERFRLHSGALESSTTTGLNTVFPVLLTVIVHIAVPPDDTVWFAGAFVTEIEGPAETTVTSAVAFHWVRVYAGPGP